jgi:metal-sulfur cluster biosynthetic enzyme
MLISEDLVFEALKTVVDPEVNLGIVELGLVYGVDLENEGKKVSVEMTLTSPMCPYGPVIIQSVNNSLKTLPGVEETDVQVVWEPQWDPKTMASDEVKDKLGIW